MSEGRRRVDLYPHIPTDDTGTRDDSVSEVRVPPIQSGVNVSLYIVPSEGLEARTHSLSARRFLIGVVSVCSGRPLFLTFPDVSGDMLHEVLNYLQSMEDRRNRVNSFSYNSFISGNKLGPVLRWLLYIRPYTSLLTQQIKASTHRFYCFLSINYIAILVYHLCQGFM